MLETQTEKILKFNNLKPFHRDIFQVQKVNFERLLIFANSQKKTSAKIGPESHMITRGKTLLIQAVLFSAE